MSQHNRVPIRVATFAALLCLAANSRPAEALQVSESSITFDGMQGTNPASLAAGKFTATGSYVVVKGEVFTNVTFKYRLKGTSGWIAGTAATGAGNSWDKTASGLVTETYECQAVLRVWRVSISGYVDYNTPDIRTVDVTGP